MLSNKSILLCKILFLLKMHNTSSATISDILHMSRQAMTVKDKIYIQKCPYFKLHIIISSHFCSCQMTYIK